MQLPLILPLCECGEPLVYSAEINGRIVYDVPPSRADMLRCEACGDLVPLPDDVLAWQEERESVAGEIDLRDDEPRRAN